MKEKTSSAPTRSPLRERKAQCDKFSGIIDGSLDTDKLCEVYKVHEAEIEYPYLADKKYCRAIVSVSFDLAVKLFEQHGRRFVRYGHTVTDADMQDHACVREVNGESMLVVIENPYEKDKSYAPVESPLSAKILGKYFEYDAGKKEYKRSKKDIPFAVKCEEIREQLTRVALISTASTMCVIREAQAQAVMEGVCSSPSSSMRI